jgi:hypothetical protein
MELPSGLLKVARVTKGPGPSLFLHTHPSGGLT